ncbi:MAG: molybdopterin-binding/glycosyltransferase family 2 protein [Pseudomonadota bacterium]
MKFGPVPLEEAEGAVLAHSIRVAKRRFGKGTVLSSEDIAALRAAGVDTVTVARLGGQDMGEDEAAALIAGALGGPHMSLSAPFTGRVNLFAEEAGILRVDAAAIAAANSVDEAVTIATLSDFSRVAPRQMLATVKIIPYAAPAEACRATASALSGHPALTVHPRSRSTASVFLTHTPGMKPSLIDKGGAAVAARLSALDISAPTPVVTAHDTDALAAALAGATGEMILILGGSATSDRDDVGPAALVAAGGTIERFGMPVDPGNLLFLGTLNDRPVIGLPGCARSPKLNGADWVLERLASGLEVTGADIQAMGVGGLLKEIPSRPQPRAGQVTPSRPRVAAILLAAGSSSRMRGRDKLTEDVSGKPLLRHAAETLVNSKVDHVIVVTRPDDTDRTEALSGLAVELIENPQADEGMGASIRAGMTRIAPECDCVLIALADMPDLTAADHDRLLAAYDAEEGREIIRATTAAGTPGNPVLFGQRFFEPLRALEGDEGARALLAAHADLVCPVPLGGESARTDLDTPEDWRRWRDG